MWHITVWPVLDHQHILATYAQRLDPDDELVGTITLQVTCPLPDKLEPGTPDHLAWVAEQLLDLAYDRG